MRTFTLVAAIALLAGSAAQAQPATAPSRNTLPTVPATPAAPPIKAAPAEAPIAAVDANFQLGIGDQVLVELVGSRDDTRTAVGSDGKVVIPLLGEVTALGLKTDELATAIQDGLKKGGYYTNPVVHVTVTGVISRYITVFGEVGTPGPMALDRTYHLSDIVSRVGTHVGENIGTIVLTHADGSSKKYTLQDIATGGGGDGDPIMQGGDKVYVPSAATELIYLQGQVRSPGPIPLGRDMTIRDAIAHGGGLTEMGSEKKLKLFRKNAQVKDLKPETLLQPGDILEIGEKLF